jgi:hypothetical protein
MKKAYLLVYSDTLGTREEVKACIDAIPEIVDWRFDLPQAFYLISEQTASNLSNLITQKMGKNGRFIIVEVANNFSGWLPKATWHLLQNKTRLIE